MKLYTIPEIAKKYIEHDVIIEHTTLPELSDLRTRLLFALLSNQHPPHVQRELYPLVALLVQLGMDTHDTIDADSGRVSEREMRSRQLKVLAGDYFSSRFYQLLAQSGQIGMITKISEGVCEVNRLKMNLYMKMKQLKVTAEDYLEQCVRIKTELFHSFTAVLDGTVAKLWPELLESVGRCEVVAEEISKSKPEETFIGSWGYWQVLAQGTDEERRRLLENGAEPAYVSSLLSKYNVHSILSEKLKQAAQHILAMAVSLEDKLEYSGVVQELKAIGESFLHQVTTVTPAWSERR